MERTSALIVLAAILAAICFSFAAYGAPTTLADAAQHATVVGALLLPVSLLLLVRSLDLQARSMAQMRQENFLALQVHALTMLIEDDRETLDSMERKYREDGKKSDKFIPIVSRRKRRMAELNRLIGQGLQMPAAVVEERA